MTEYIEREALRQEIDRIYQKHFAKSREKSVQDVFKAFFKRIDKAPAADVAPVVHGRWFDTGVENATGNIYFCSVCRKYNNPNKKDVEMKRTKEKPAYCPNCGAKMELEGGEG